MASVQRAFAQKISKQHAADVRRQISSSYSRDLTKSGSSVSGFSSSVSLCDIVDPLDYEDFIQQHQLLVDRDPLRHVLDFPVNDVEVGILPRKIRTLSPITPSESIENLPLHIRYCVQSYASDWIVVSHRYLHHSSSCWVRDRAGERLALVQGIPQQEFEVDLEQGAFSNTPDDEGYKDSNIPLSEQCINSVDTPRGSWASFDLRNSISDALIPSLLERIPPETVDQLNEAKRTEERQDAVFSLFPAQDEEDIIERRFPAEIPSEHMGHRILVKCLQLKLDLEVEPIFAIMALYDAKEKKKVSENFYFDMNSEAMKRMLGSHIPYCDISTLSRSCIFDITYPSTDLFLVIKLEKVLQGDISECAEPYMKDDKNRDKVKSNAVASCERLGKYRMPFAWTAIYLMNIINGVNSLERDSGSDKESTGSNSLDRKSSSGSFDRKKTSDVGSLTRRGSLERRSASEKRRSWSPEDFGSTLDSFRPVKLTVSSFFKQMLILPIQRPIELNSRVRVYYLRSKEHTLKDSMEPMTHKVGVSLESDKLRDEDLYKFLQDLKRPCSVMKKLKCIPGTLKLDVAPCPDEVKYSITTELARLHPYPDEKGRPTKEVLEFPAREVFVPHYTYRNLLFVYPKELNFAGRAGSARNIAVKVQLMNGEEDQDALAVIFGKSSCPEFTSEAYTTVNYHNKCPEFYDEIKIKIPANLADNHHLLFTFYHISCQRKIEQPTVETPVGYTWLPIFNDGCIQTGEYCLPVMMEHPPPNYSFIPPDVMLPGTKWVDNHKGIFSVSLEAASSVHIQDRYLNKFLNLCSAVEEGNIPQRIGEANIENELKNSILDLKRAKLEPLVKFLPLIFDKLIFLMVKPPSVGGQLMNIGSTAFETIAVLVQNISQLQEGHKDQHGRHSLLTTYINYQCNLPYHMEGQTLSGISPPLSPGYMPHPTSVQLSKKPLRSNSNPDLHGVDEPDEEVSSISKGLDRTLSMRTSPNHENHLHPITKVQPKKIVHEELALQWVMSSGSAKELALTNSWFFFELIVKSMIQHLAATHNLDAPRKIRFVEQFTDDITTLVATVTSDIISRCNKDQKLSQCLNSSLAFFLFDLFSVMDRGYVFTLVKLYYKQISTKIFSLSDAISLISFKLDFLRIICSHEHYVALNLPFGTPFTPSSAPASPNPSIASSTSQSSFISTLVGGDKTNFAELTADFRQQHFLVGLVLSDLASVLDLQNPGLHHKAVNIIRNLMTCHDCDPRYSEQQCKARVAALYLPLIGIVMDSLPQLYSWNSEYRGRTLLGQGHDEMDPQTSINQSVAMAIAGSSMFGNKTNGAEDYDPFKQPRKSALSSDTSRNLLMCFLWVIKNTDKNVLKLWWADLPLTRIHQLLEVLNICISCFEYKGKKAIKRCAQQNFRKTSDIKSRLEDVILGQGSARSEMMMRRKERKPPSPGWPGDRLRWRKDQMAWRPYLDTPERPRAEVETDAHIEGNLATEVSLIILDTLELIVQVSSLSDNLQGLLGVVLKLLLHALARNQSTCVLQCMFATQRSIVFKYPNLLFDEESEQCADLCLRLLKHCSSNIGAVRSQASASLYLLMRQNFEIGNNFARVKMQVTMSLSSLVGTSQAFSEESLRRSLKTILVYAEEDSELQDTTFPEQVKDLVFNLHMILSDTVKMKEFQEDPEMLLDLMYRIAKGYQNSPDLRLTWLANMAQKHMERNNHTEAAMCLVHSSALVAEYLHMLEDLHHLPVGAVSFEHVTPNALEESAVSDDVLSPDEDGVCLGKDFTESGLVGLLEHAANSFHMAGMYEAMNYVYKILIPIAESNRDYKKLSNIHGKLHEAFNRVEQLQGKRVFGTYFRVGFYGAKFGDLNGEEFIYKEPTLTKLPEIFSRLENFYAERFGAENVIIIKDSNAVDPENLDPEKAYIQITYVEPYFEVYEQRYRLTHFDRNYNIKRFLYATPFTPDGRAHGELHEQYKRKTILTTANHFPYVKTRIQVVAREQIVLTPIDVAIEDIQKKTVELALATQQEPPDPKILQMVLQGCIGTTVNQGPMEVALVFLSDMVDSQKAPTKSQNKLRLCFKDFSKKCADALRKNKNLIGPDQRDYQRELERNYHRFTDRLMPLITINNNVGRTLRNRR